MKKCLKSTLSILLAAVLLLTIVPFGASAAETTKLTFTASNKNAVPGETVDVDIVMTNNPGIASIGLNLGYDSDILTIENITFNSAMGGTTQTSQLTKNPAKLIWISSTSNYNGDATVATITFRVNGDITDNVTTNVELTYDPDDIYNLAEDNIDCDIVNGVVNVVAAVPGDINGDTKVNNKDVTRLLQYLAQWDVFVNAPTLDTNGDGKVNNKDVTRLMQYLAHWDVEIYVGPNSSSPACTHQLTKIDAVAASCEEDGNITYWHCEECGKNFADVNAVREIKLEDTVVEATGHTPEVIPAVPATYESEGSTEGSRCSVCGKVLVEPQPVPILQKDAYSITYHLYDGDTYLQEVGVNNPNSDYYTTQDGYIAPDGAQKLKNLTVAGYIFDGWYDSEGANGILVSTIPAGTRGEVELYARWRVREYTVNFNSPLVPVPSQTYKVNTGTTLTNPTLNGYNFIGWCDENNKLVTNIPVGTTGNMTLYANWTSKRNQTRPISRLADPLILEDAENGTILFAYEIGTVENVPIKQINNGDIFQSVGGMKQTFTTQESVNITDTEAKNIAKTVGNTTTESKAWTLSEQWNDVTSVSESYAQQKGWTKEEAEQHSKTSSNTYSMNSSSGGSQTNTASNGLSGTLSTSNSSTAGGGYSTERETGSEYTVTDKASVNSELAFSMGVPKVAETSGKISAGLETSESSKNYENNKSSVNLNYSNTGTNGQSVTGQESNVSSGTSTWNTSSGYSSSNTVSQTSSVRNVLSEVINTSKSYGSSYARGGSNNESQSFANSATVSDQYSSAITFAKGETTTNSKTIELGGESEGYYRFVLAGTAHVYAVVGYDVAKSCYFTYTYTVMDDSTYTFIDYSKTTPNFNDNENGVLPFEVPYFVKEYVDIRLRQSEGLQISQEGVVTGYTGTGSIVIIPSYYRMDNLDGGTYTSIKVTGIAPDLFAGKEVTAVLLSSFITEIPNGAFKNCTALTEIVAPGVTSIGAEAFSGCTSLSEFNVPDTVTSIGENAFKDIPRISVESASLEAATGAINSGANDIVLNISKNPDEIQNAEFVISDATNYFELRGNAKEYDNVKIKSDAAKTVINGLTINCDKGIPLNISSPDVTLNRVTVNSKGYAALFTNPETDISLYGSINLNSDNGKTVVSRSINLSQIDPSIYSTLNVSGNVLLCGEISGRDFLKQQNGSIIVISEEDFEKYARGAYEVSFFGNGGNVKAAPKTVYYGSAYGVLPTATRDYYSFDGWYTDPNSGNQVTENTIFEQSEDISLYAHWTINPTSDWVLASEVPEGARIENAKWSYTEREYTSSGNSTMSGWTKYDTKVTGYGSTQGPVYSNPGGNNRKVWSESYKIRDNYKTVWHYSRSVSGTTGWSNWQVYHSPNVDYLASGPQYITLDYQLSRLSQYDTAGCAAYGRYYIDGWDCPIWFNEWSESVYVNSDYGTRWYYQDPIYTYYYYRDVNKESSSEITNGGDISNTQKWVKYIEK